MESMNDLHIKYTFQDGLRKLGITIKKNDIDKKVILNERYNLFIT